MTVAQYLLYADRYGKRSRRDRLVGEELLRLAVVILDQPPDLSVPEALARSTGWSTAARGVA